MFMHELMNLAFSFWGLADEKEITVQHGNKNTSYNKLQEYKNEIFMCTASLNVNAEVTHMEDMGLKCENECMNMWNEYM